MPLKPQTILAVLLAQGLRAGGYQFETEEYWDFIRAGRENYLKPDPKVTNKVLQFAWNCS